MSWQDIVLTSGSIIFIIALIPSVRSKDKPSLTTSLLTAAVLITYVITYVSLHLWFSAVTVAATSATWYILGWQKYSVDKKQDATKVEQKD